MTHSRRDYRESTGHRWPHGVNPKEENLPETADKDSIKRIAQFLDDLRLDVTTFHQHITEALRGSSTPNETLSELRKETLNLMQKYDTRFSHEHSALVGDDSVSKELLGLLWHDVRKALSARAVRSVVLCSHNSLIGYLDTVELRLKAGSYNSADLPLVSIENILKASRLDNPDLISSFAVTAQLNVAEHKTFVHRVNHTVWSGFFPQFIVMCDTFSELCKKDGISFHSKVSKALYPAKVPESFKSLFNQILPQFVTNAIENLKGLESKSLKKISLLISADGEHWTFRIKDNGSGIAQEIRDKLFTLGASTKGEGRGKALSQVKSLLAPGALFINPKIEVESTSKRGTTFLIQVDNPLKS